MFHWKKNTDLPPRLPFSRVPSLTYTTPPCFSSTRRVTWLGSDGITSTKQKKGWESPTWSDLGQWDEVHGTVHKRARTHTHNHAQWTEVNWQCPIRAINKQPNLFWIFCRYFKTQQQLRTNNAEIVYIFNTAKKERKHRATHNRPRDDHGKTTIPLLKIELRLALARKGKNHFPIFKCWIFHWKIGTFRKDMRGTGEYKRLGRPKMQCAKEDQG